MRQVRTPSGIRRALGGVLRVRCKLLRRRVMPRFASLMRSRCRYLPRGGLPAHREPPPCKPIPPTKLEAAYTATLLGFPIGGYPGRSRSGDNRFSAAANGETSGLLRIFAQGHGVAEARGTLAGKQPLAANFKVSFTSGSSTDEMKIVFNGGKAKEYLAHPPTPNPDLVPLTEAYRTGVVDPMTALLIHVPGSGDTAAPAACERKIAVFDGRMRYDLRLAFKRIEQVRAETGYRGPAVVCAVYFSPLAGYDPTATPSDICKPSAAWRCGWRRWPVPACWCRSGSRCRRRLGWRSCRRRALSGRGRPDDQARWVPIELPPAALAPSHEPVRPHRTRHRWAF